MSALPTSTSVHGRFYAVLFATLSVTLIFYSTAMNAGSAWAVTLVEPPINLSPPVISGTPQPGQTLNCDRGTWTGSGTIEYAYEWSFNGSEIYGEDAASYVVRTADVGGQIICTVFASNGIGFPVSASSEPVTVTSPSSGTGDQPPGVPSDGSGSGKTELPSASKAIRFPSTKKCVSRRKFKIKIRRFSGITWEKASISVNDKSEKVVKGKRLRAAINLSGLPKGRFTVKITVWADDGQKVEGKRKYRTCSRKKKSKGPKI